MNRITSYIFSQLSFATILVTLTVTCAFWLTQSLRFIELVVNRGLSLVVFMRLTGLLIPSQTKHRRIDCHAQEIKGRVTSALVNTLLLAG